MTKAQAVFIVIGCLILAARPNAIGQDTNKKLPGKWTLVTSISKMDDKKTSILALPANEDVSAWPVPVRPMFVVACGRGRLIVSVETVASVNPERGGEATIRLRLGTDAPIVESWTKNDKGQMLFSPSGDSLLRALAKTDRLLFEFTPFNSNSTVAEFDVRELEGNLAALAPEGCEIGMAVQDGPRVTIRGFVLPAPKGAHVNEISPQMNYVTVGFSKSELAEYYGKAMKNAGWMDAGDDCWTQTEPVEHKICIIPRDGYVNVQIIK